MKNLLKILFVVIFTYGGVKAQYISEVLEYKPAPGQFINSSPHGIPSAANSLTGPVEGLINLGSFGGYVIFRFDEPVENHSENPYGIDFTVFGNPTPAWSEPGIVSVMKDVNKNGRPDDQWYELAGSDYYFSSTRRNYRVTYTNPGDSVARDVPWSDNSGNTGFIFANDYHTQPYYPDTDSFESVNNPEYSLEGTCISLSIDRSNPLLLKSRPRAFGYADNTPVGIPPYTIPDNPYTDIIENSGGDPFDISWAVDENGNYKDLDRIHFIKVHNAVLEQAGWLGEISTEIRGAVDVEPGPSISGVKEMIVIKDLPDTLSEPVYQLEVFYFIEGRLQENMEVEWKSNIPGAWVDNNFKLNLTQSGDLTLTANLINDPGINTTVHSKIVLKPTTKNHGKTWTDLLVYPNPASSFIHIRGSAGSSVKIYDLQGRIILEDDNIYESKALIINHLQKGSYILQIHKGNNYRNLKFLKY